jgi:hypothetical protein
LKLHLTSFYYMNMNHLPSFSCIRYPKIACMLINVLSSLDVQGHSNSSSIGSHLDVLSALSKSLYGFLCKVIWIPPVSCFKFCFKCHISWDFDNRPHNYTWSIINLNCYSYFQWIFLNLQNKTSMNYIIFENVSLYFSLQFTPSWNNGGKYNWYWQLKNKSCNF